MSTVVTCPSGYAARAKCCATDAFVARVLAFALAPGAQKLLSENITVGPDDEFLLPDPMLQWLGQAQKGKPGSRAKVTHRGG
jgi:hypothetical protein